MDSGEKGEKAEKLGKKEKLEKKEEKGKLGRKLPGPEKVRTNSLSAPLTSIALIAVTALVVYSNTLNGPFLFDDDWYVVNNVKIRDLGNFLDLSGTRYVTFLTFALNYYFGGLDPFGYHLANIVIHMVNGLLVWWLVILTFRTPAMERTAGEPGLKYLVALVAALIFVSHPIQTQAVSYITQRFASLATLFYLLSLVLYVKWRFSRRWWLYAVSLLSAIVAMKTKEIAFTLPAMLCLYELAFFPREGFSKRLPALVPFLLTMAIIPLTYFAPEFGPELGIGEKGSDAAEKIRELNVLQMKTLSRYEYFATQMRVI
ncbi:MAG: hypothetical protein V3W31_07095, partial [Thermodesulfobacteriota bacterium]